MIHSIKNNILYSALLLILPSILTAVIILTSTGKVIVAFSLLQLLVIVFIKAPPITIIAFPIIMITFPITLQVFGRDAFTTGTLVIFIVLAWAISKFKFIKTMVKDRGFFLLLFLLCIIAFIGMTTKTPSAYWGPAIRQYVNFISSIAAFILIIHAKNIRGMTGSDKEYIEKIISTLLFLTVLHVYLSLLIFNSPEIEKYFTIFLDREKEHLGYHVLNNIYVRATSIFTGGEEFGELLILMFPFALYRIFFSKKLIYWFVIASLLLGMLLTGTRSAFLLMVFQILVFVCVLVPAKYNRKKILFIVTFSLICLLMLPFFLEYAPILMDRVQLTLDQIGQKENLIIVLNRSNVWPMAWDLTVKTISIFGHGPIQARGIGFPVENFHNLYMSLLFQFGVIGFTVFLIFFLSLAKRLYSVAKKIKRENTGTYLLALSCLISLFCFLINEIKFDFNRSDSYQQFVWCIFAIFYLCGTIGKNTKNEKYHHHQPRAIRL